MRDDLYEIGFNTQVEVGDRSLHVQTEISRQNGGTVRTAVLEGGAILHVEKRPCETDLFSRSEIEARVSTVHESVVDKVRSGKLG